MVVPDGLIRLAPNSGVLSRIKDSFMSLMPSSSNKKSEELIDGAKAMLPPWTDTINGGKFMVEEVTAQIRCVFIRYYKLASRFSYDLWNAAQLLVQKASFL